MNSLLDRVRAEYLRLNAEDGRDDDWGDTYITSIESSQVRALINVLEELNVTSVRLQE